MLPTAANRPPCILSAFRFYAVRPTYGLATSEGVVLWHLDDHNSQPIRVSYLHLAQPPRLVSWELDNIHSSLRQHSSYGVHVSHLQPQAHVLICGSVRGARKLDEASTEEEHDAPVEPLRRKVGVWRPRVESVVPFGASHRRHRGHERRRRQERV
jgi:hypothetical protein